MRLFGLILLSHGGLADGMLSAVEMIMGPRENTEVISLKPGMGLQDMSEQIQEKLDRLDHCKHVLLVSDVFGGTPNNCAIIKSRDDEDRVRIVTGVNLPMLLHFFSTSTVDPDLLVKEMQDMGREGIQVGINEIVAEEKQSLN